MKFRFEKSLDVEEIVAYAKERDDFINSIENMCLQSNNKIIGYDEGIIKELNPMLVECFYTSGDKVFALFDGDEYLVKKRLYEINELVKETFIYINQGCLANVNMIDYFDASIGGALLVVFKSGYKDYVSRRQIKKVKERIGVR